jgi:methionine biosynthesis protein MetW
MDIENFYEKIAQAKKPQGSLTCYEDDRWAKIKKLVNSQGSSLKILDVGCGNGWQASFFLKGNEVFGLDISESNVSQACSRGIIARKHDIETPFPFQVGSFDLVVCSEVLEHLFNPENILKEIVRVLKPGGAVIISVPNLFSLGNRMSLLYGKKCTLIEYPYNQEHIRHYSIKRLKNILGSFGLKTKKVIGTSFTMNLLDLNPFSFIFIALPYLIAGAPFLLFSLLWHLFKLDFDLKKIVLTANFYYMYLLGYLWPSFSSGIILKLKLDSK